MNETVSTEDTLRKRNGMLSHLATRIFIRLMCNQLAKTSRGFLEIKFGEKTYQFGNSKSKQQVLLTVHDKRFFQWVVLRGHLGFAEAFGRGYCTTSELTEMLTLFAHNFTVVDKAENGLTWLFNNVQYFYYRYFEQNTRAGSKRNIQAHYDLGNDLFALFLDSDRQYSSALFPSDTATLEEAQRFKMKTICHHLSLKKEDHVLEIGSGWGGLALFIAKHSGCKVTTITLSNAQFDYAKQKIIDEGLEKLVTIKRCDYRDITGKYDKIVSIEMIEAVGDKYYPIYFETCRTLLKPGGLLLMQAILIADHEYQKAKHTVDFIKRYIFPGSNIPSLNRLNECANRACFRLDRYVDITSNYVKTLAMWQKRFNEQGEKLAAMGYDNYFQAIWNFYFSYCQAGFTVEHIRDAHLLFKKR